MSDGECVQGSEIEVIVGGMFKGRVSRINSDGTPRVMVECDVARDDSSERWIETHSFPTFDGIEVLNDDDVKKLEDGTLPPLPEVGDEVHVDIAPEPVFGATYEQIGDVLATWTTPGGRQRIIVQITRSLNDVENVNGIFTDDVWINSVFLAVAPGSSECGLRGGAKGQWVARIPVSDQARELWDDAELAQGGDRVAF